MKSELVGGMKVYINRHTARTILNLSRHFPVIMVCGSRQTGKTTIFEETIVKPGKGDISTVSLDDPVLLQSTLNEGGRFFLDHRPPVFIDEVKYAPELFPYIKIIADKEKKPGQFFLTGSQQFSLMKDVSESLAGRIGIIDLLGLSIREIENDIFSDAFCPNPEYYQARKKPINISYEKLWEYIWRGSMPRLYADPALPKENFYSAYVRTYIERDVRSIINIGDERKFLSFIRSSAARTGQLLNITKLADESDISRTTAERWLSILITSGLVFLLRPFHVNISKRETKTPKLYFLDTGLASFLTGWNNAGVLRLGAMGGAFFETFVLSEIIKSYYNTGAEPPIFYYRDKDQNEIDLLIWQNGKLHPLEIKMTANPDKRHISAFRMLDSLAPPYERGEGGIICCYPELISLGESDKVIPFTWL